VVVCPNKGAYQVGKHEIPGGEVDRWRKLRAIPVRDRKVYYADAKNPTRNGLLKWWKSRNIDQRIPAVAVLLKLLLQLGLPCIAVVAVVHWLLGCGRSLLTNCFG